MAAKTTGSTTPLHYLDASTLAMRTRAVPPVGIMQAHPDHIDAIDPALPR